MTYLPISQWSEDDRPREKLSRLGPENLSDSELIAILLGKGYEGTSAVDLAKQVLKDCGDITGLNRRSPGEMIRTKGIGPAKAVTIKAALELGKRVADQPSMEKVNFSRPSAVYNHFRYKLRDKKEEYFYTLLLNQKNNLIREQMVSKGTLTASVVHPREVLKDAIRESAASFIAVHNHPSGVTEPSPEDLDLTRRLMKAARVIGIQMLDHIIIGYDTYLSLFEHYPELR